MNQSRRMSLIEASTNTAVGYLLAVMTQLVVFPLFQLPARLPDVLSLGAIFTLTSIVRSYALRRLFEGARGRMLNCQCQAEPAGIVTTPGA